MPAAQCPLCQQPAVLDLRASMFNHSNDIYACPKCDRTWTIEKRTGQLKMDDRGLASLGG